jgi:beta-hydroxylase
MSGRLRERVAGYVDRARYLVPAEDLARPFRRRFVIARGTALFTLFDLNDAAISRWGGDLPHVWDASRFRWIDPIEQATDDIVEELRAYLDTHDPIPQVAEIAGLQPGSEEAMNSAPVDRGTWRALILLANGRWIDETTRYFPKTRAAVAQCPQMTTIGFSVLEPHSHIALHVGTNRGALRYQLPVVVPGEPGDCRIKISDDMVVWEKGKSVLFDLGAWHEAWNDAPSQRVLFMIETAMPLRAPLSWLNRVVQYQFRFFPSFRDMPDRVRALERERVHAGG